MATESKILIPNSVYRVVTCLAQHGYTSTGRTMYTVTLIIEEGEYAGYPIYWRLIEVKEHPRLLHKFFNGLTALGVGPMEYACMTDPEDVVRQIIRNGHTLEVITKINDAGFVEIYDVRRILIS